jgi:CRP-like cAMP-binding protein
MDQLTTLLSIDPDARTTTDILDLTDLLLRTQLFESITQHIDMQAAVESCARKMRVKRIGAGSLIYRSGEETREFYFVVKGQLSVAVPQGILLANFNKKKPSIILTALAKSVLTPSFIARVKADYSRTKDPAALVEVACIGSGCSFGDLALVRSIPLIFATTATEETLLAYLSKAEFDQTMHRVQDRLFNEKVAFLESLLPFKRLTMKGLYRVAHSFHYRAYRKHQAVYSEGDATDYVFIIISGEFEFSKTTKSTDRVLKVSPNMRRSLVRKKHLRLFSRSPRDFFGQEDLYENRNRFATCTCLSPKGEVYCIDRLDFNAQAIQSTVGEVLKSQHNQLEQFQQNLLEKSTTFDEMLRSHLTEDNVSPPSWRLESALRLRNTPKSISPIRKISPSKTEEHLFPIKEKPQFKRHYTLRNLDTTENPKKQSLSPTKQTPTDYYDSARTSALRQRSQKPSNPKSTISPVRTHLMQTKPLKYQSSFSRLKDRTILKLKRSAMSREATLKQLLQRQWE